MEKEIIDPRLVFYGFDEFYLKKIQIKTLFHLKNRKEKLLYRWYLYQQPFMSDTLKNYTWDWLQSDINDCEFAIVYSDYKRKKYQPPQHEYTI